MCSALERIVPSTTEGLLAVEVMLTARAVHQLLTTRGATNYTPVPIANHSLL